MNNCSINWKDDGARYNIYVTEFINYGKEEDGLEKLLSSIDNYTKQNILDVKNIQDILTKAIEIAKKENLTDIISNLEFAAGQVDSFITNEKAQIIDNEKARLNFEQTDKFIPGLNAELNNFIFSRVQNELFSICYYSPENGITSPSSLSDSIMAYKEGLYKILCDYTGYHSYDNLLDVLEGKAVNYSLYSTVMNRAWYKLQNDIVSLNKSNVSDPKTQELLKVISAFYYLNNFDDFITKASKGLVTVNPNLKGTLEVTRGKYQMIDQQKVNGSFEGSHADSDAALQESKIFYAFWGTISDGNNGFLTKSDFRSICTYIKQVLNEGNDSTFDFLVNSALNEQQVMDAFIDVLEKNQGLKHYIGPNGDAITKNIAEAFRNFYNDKNDHYSYLQSVKDEAEAQQKIDFITQFKNEILGHDNKAYVARDEKGNTIVNSASRISMSKESLINKIRKVLTENMHSWNFYLYQQDWDINPTATTAYSVDVLNYINKITGINLSSEQLNKIFSSTANITTLFKFIEAFKTSVMENLIPRIRAAKGDQTLETELINDFLQKMKMSSPSYLEFSDLYINQNLNKTIKIMDQSSNPQPIHANPNTIQQFKKNLLDFSSQMRNLTTTNNENILVKWKQITAPNRFNNKSTLQTTKYIEHIAYRQDVAYEMNGQKRVLKANEMNPDEILTVAFNNEFIDAILNQSTFYNQVECYSDKVTIALAAYNMDAVIPGLNKAFLQLTTKELQNQWYQQRKFYYQAVQQKITTDLQKVFNKPGADLVTLIKELESLKVVEFEKKVAEYNRNNPNDQVTITKEIHYSELNGQCVFNNTLWFNFVTTNSDKFDDKYLQDYYQIGLEDVRHHLSFIQIPAKFKSRDFIERNLYKLAALFDIEVDSKNEQQVITDLSKFFNKEGGTWYNKTSDATIKKMQEAITGKYFILQQLSTEAELQITSKENVIHKGKKQLSISTYESDPKTFYENVKNDESLRLIVGKKRNNSEVASLIPMDTTTKHGVAPHSRIAVVKSKNQFFMNYNMQKVNQDVIDGGLYTLGIAVVWENKSYGSKKIEDVKKVIGIVPTDVGIEQFKCADYPLDNILIAESFSADNIHLTGQPVSSQALEDTAPTYMYTRAKKMMQTGIITDKFCQAYTNPNRRDIGVEVKKYFGNVLGQLTDVQCVDPATKTFSFTWINADTNEVILSETHNINNVFDLWEALGSYNTVEESEGEYIPSNSSMEYIAYAISEYDRSMKESITSKIIDVSANKSSIVNINQIDDVDTTDLPLNTSLIDNTRWGMQQDYSHEADESTIPSLTQVISAVAFNGKNINKVKGMYDALAQLTMLKARELGVKAAPTEEQEFAFHRKLVKMLINSLQGNNSRSNALAIARQAYDKMKEMGDLKDFNLQDPNNKQATIPYSAPDIFYKLASDLISNLNSKSIRQVFNGVAIVQNPSHSEIAIYEDNQGRTYKRQDLLNIGRKLLPAGSVNATELDIITAALTDARFQPQKITDANQLELEDTYLIDGIEKRIKTPKDLYDANRAIINATKLGLSCYKIFGRQRDLKVPSVHFYENGIYQNLWLINATQKRFDLESDPTATAVERKEALLWYRANLQGLGETTPYYYKTDEDFRKDRKTYVENVTFVPGEQIIPKVNKSAQGLGSQTLAQISEQNIEYFKAQTANKYKSVAGLQLVEVVDSQGKVQAVQKDAAGNIVDNATETRSVLKLVRDSDEVVYSYVIPQYATKLEKPIIAEQTELINGVEKTIYYYQDELFHNVFAIPSKENTDIYYTVQGGKKIYYVVNANQQPDSVKDAVHCTYNVNTIWEEKANQLPSQFSSLLNEYNQDFDPNHGNVDKQISRIAQKLYRSFELSNYTISARIPSQAFQSFMANKTVAFMTSGQNNGYINIFEVWFTGGDYDIDKSYTMLFSLDNTGAIATNSKLSNLTSIKTLTASLQLPSPNRKKLILTGETTTLDGDTTFVQKLVNLLPKYGFTSAKEVEIALRSNDEKSVLKALGFCQEALEYINEIKNLSITEEDFQNNKILISLLNRHNSSRITAEGLKNKIVSTVYSCAADVKNLEASSQPMDSDAIKSLIKEIETEKGTKDKVYNNMSPYTKFAIQYENSVGKKNVGIAANGVKAASAIQQYFNEAYTAWDGSLGTLDSVYRFNVPIKLYEMQPTQEGQPAELREIWVEDVHIMGDTVLDYDEEKARQKFITLNSDGSDVRYQTTFNDLQQLISNNGEFPAGKVLRPDGSYVEYYSPIIDQETKKPKLKSQYADLKSTYDLFLKYNPGFQLNTAEDYWNFMFFKRKFNANVADMISIFISLATDNAKELVLARINATPELMSMPLAMLTLGMPPKQVMDVCINLLDPIAKMLQKNRLQESANANVRNLIASCKEYDDTTKQSLIKIFDFAQELRAITSFFKVNQGVTASYVELLAFYKRLENTLPTIAKRQKKESLVSNISLEALFTHKYDNNEQAKAQQLENKQNAVNEFEKIKTGINVIDVVLKNDNFRSMLEALQLDFETMQYIAGVAKFINTRSLQTDDSEDFDVDKYRKLIRLYQDFIVGKTLTSDTMSEIRFTAAGIKESMKLSKLELPLATRFQFGLDTAEGLDNFMAVMDNYVIPKLKERYPNNFFMKALTQINSRALGKNIWSVTYDVFDDEDVAEQQNVKNATLALEEIQHYPSGLQTIYGQNLTIGDVMYLYNLIATKNQMSGMSKVVTTVADNTHSKYHQLLSDMYVKYDRLARDNDEGVIQEFTNMGIYQTAILNGGSASRDGVTIDLSGAYIWTMTPVKNKQLPFDAIVSAEGDSVSYTADKIGNDVVFTFTVKNSNQNGISFKQTVQNVTDISDAKKRMNSDALSSLRNRIRFYKNVQSKLGGLKKVSLDELVSNGNIFSPEWAKVAQAVMKESAYISYTPTRIQSVLMPIEPGFVLRLEDNQPKVVINDPDLIGEQNLLDLLIQANFTETATSEEKVRFLNDKLANFSESERKAAIDKYLTYLEGAYPEQDIVETVAGFESRMLMFMNDANLYYRDAVQSEQLAVTEENMLMEGDQVEFTNDPTDEDGDRPVYNYVGFIHNKHVFVGYDGSIKQKQNLSDAILQRRLRVDSTFVPVDRPGIVNGAVVNMAPSLPLNAGTKIRQKGDNLWYNIYATMYDMIEENGNVSYKTLYLVRDNKGFRIISHDNVTSYQPILTAKQEEETYSTEITINRQFDSAVSYLNQLSAGDEVTVNDMIYTFRKKINNTYFLGVDNTGKLINLKYNEVNQIRTNRSIGVDNKFLASVEPLSLFISNSNELSIANNPLLAKLLTYKGYTINDKKIKARNSIFFRSNGNWVYKLPNYTQVNAGVYNVGDIFITRGNPSDVIYKITNVSTKVTGQSSERTYELSEITMTTDRYNTMPERNNSYKIHYVSEKQAKSLFENSEHYTTNQNTILMAQAIEMKAKEPKRVKSTSIQASQQIVDWLEESLGVIVQEDSSLQTVAQFKNGVITVRDINTLNDEAVHEFSHLVIGMMQVIDPDAYYSVLNNFETNIIPTLSSELQKDWAAIQADTEHYSSYTDQITEMMVRVLDYSRAGIQVETMNQLETFVNNGFSRLFGTNLRSVDQTKSMEWVLTKYKGESFFSEIASNIDILKLRKAQRRKKIMDNIKEICK